MTSAKYCLHVADNDEDRRSWRCAHAFQPILSRWEGDDMGLVTFRGVAFSCRGRDLFINIFRLRRRRSVSWATVVALSARPDADGSDDFNDDHVDVAADQ